MNISGDVIDRIDGSPISGSTIQYSGPETKSVLVTNGRYQLDSIVAGSYQVLITGPTHVDHKTLKVPVSANDSNVGFTVLEYNSSMFGVIFDKDFEQFFDAIARCAQYCGSSQPMTSFDLDKYPLQEIYVTNELLSEAGMNNFLSVLNEVNNESTKGMSGSKLDPLPIVKGPPIGSYVDGKIVVRFNTTGAGGNEGCVTNYVARCATVAFGNITFEPETKISRDERKDIVLHELAHAFAADHAYNNQYSFNNRSIMGGDSRVTTLSPVDLFAFWLKNGNIETKPGNTYPDTNPTR